MNDTLEPREVDKPFVRRWLGATLALFLRSPIRFGILIASLGGLDTTAVHIAQGYVVEKIWVDRLGTLALPLLWVLVSAVARGADDRRLSMEALCQLRRRTVWIGALAAGSIIASLEGIFGFAFQGIHTGLLGLPRSQPYLQNQGQFLDSIEASVIMIAGFAGLCYFPLLVLAPDISPREASQLSRKADQINGSIVLILLIGTLVLTADAVSSSVPAYGMTTAACLVFIGVLNYVAYRDIFERRSGNLPKQAAETQIGRRSPVHSQHNLFRHLVA
jgi:hypothetical protein